MTNDKAVARCGFRLGRGLLRRVDEMAAAEERSRSKMISILLREALDARGAAGRERTGP